VPGETPRCRPAIMLRTRSVGSESVCHTYWYVYFGQGNVAQNIFEGDAPATASAAERIPAFRHRQKTTVKQILGMFWPEGMTVQRSRAGTVGRSRSVPAGGTLGFA